MSDRTPLITSLRLPYLFFWLLIARGLPIYGQVAEVGFDRFALSEGLSHTTVYTIAQDAYGYLWVGTKEGLNRFDGYRFLVFDHSVNDSTSLSGSSIQQLKLDAQNQLWVGTNQGLNVFSTSQLANRRIRPPGNAIGDATSLNIWCLIQGPDKQMYVGTDNGVWRYSPADKTFSRPLPVQASWGRVNALSFSPVSSDIWLATQRDGLWRYQPDTRQLSQISTQQGLWDVHVQQLCWTDSDHLWLSTSQGIQCYRPSMEAFDAELSALLPRQAYTQILFDSAGYLWAGTPGNGLLRLHLSTRQVQHLKHEPQRSASLPNNFINALFQDKQGAMWVGTSKGLARYDQHRKNFEIIRNQPGVEHTLNSNTINHLLRDTKGRLWVATKDGGINQWDDALQGFRYHTHQPNNPHSLLDDRVNGLSEHPDGSLWAATASGVAQMNVPSGRFRNFSQGPEVNLSGLYVQTVLCDKAGNVWVGTVNGLDRYTGKAPGWFAPVPLLRNAAGQSEQFLINNLVEGQDGEIWIGTFGYGVIRYWPKTGRVQQYRHLPKGGGLSSDHIYFLLYQQGTLWVGTNGMGLDRLDTHTGAVKSYNENDGLPNSVINGILPDAQQNLWLSTNNGLARLHVPTEKIKSFGMEYGLPSNLFRRRACLLDTDGRMFFGGNDGLVAFYPSQIRDNPTPPIVHIRSLGLMLASEQNDTWEYQQTYEQKYHELPHYKNHLLIDFIALSYTVSQRNQYKYRLVGFEKNWRHANDRRQAEYTNLPPGKYQFQVIASNDDQVWNELGDTLHITILPPWWLTWWAVLLELLLAAALIYGLVRWRLHAVLVQKRRLERLVKQRTAELVESQEELRAQRDELEQQTTVLAHQAKQITDSINYAERMQRALLRSGDQLSEHLPSHFIFFRPRGVVSGDFYWSGFIGSKFTVVAADCTGHGVPGALLSVMGIAFLNEISATQSEYQAGEVLDFLRARIKRVFMGSTTSHIVSDGMDMTLCMLHPGQQRLEYAAAYNSLYRVRGGEIEKFEADSMPIGYYIREQRQFTTHYLDVQPDDTFYMFSDGMVDQFGGPNGHKFMLKNMKRLLLSVSQLPIGEQKHAVQSALDEHRGSLSQVDDMLMIGFRAQPTALPS